MPAAGLKLYLILNIFILCVTKNCELKDHQEQDYVTESINWNDTSDKGDFYKSVMSGVDELIYFTLPSSITKGK